MNYLIIGSAAIILYLAALAVLARDVFKIETRQQNASRLVLGLGIAALLLHFGVLYLLIIEPVGLNLGVSQSLSLIGACITLIVIAASWFLPLGNLLLLLFPLSAIFLSQSLLSHDSYHLSDSLNMGLKFHIILSVLAYSLLSLASLQALVLAFQKRQLRNKNPMRIMHLLPPMQDMQTLLIQFISVGFFLLSLSLVTGVIFIENIFTQHLSHKVFLSCLAWLLYGILLFGYWKLGWNGKRIIRWTIGAFISLVLAYFGSKIVLELILQRI